MSADSNDDNRGPTFPSADETMPPGTRVRIPPNLGNTTSRITVEVFPQHGIPPLRVPMTGEKLIIGREEGDIRIEDLLVSRRHASIEVGEGGQPTLRDLESTNGTFLNGALLIAPAQLRDGDDIRIGPSHLLVRIVAD